MDREFVCVIQQRGRNVKDWAGKGGKVKGQRKG